MLSLRLSHSDGAEQGAVTMQRNRGCAYERRPHCQTRRNGGQQGQQAKPHVAADVRREKPQRD